MAIYITGDTHGMISEIDRVESLTAIKRDDYLIICGDFGFVMSNDDNQDEKLDYLANKEYKILFVDGNHEDFPALYSYPVEIWNGGKIHRVRDNIYHLMRGQVFTIEGKKFFTFGGAYSIDKAYQMYKGRYFEDEIPKDEEYEEADKNLALNNNRVDYIITHTAPAWIIKQIGKYPDAHDMQLTSNLERYMFSINFEHWYAGHWHIDKRVTHNFTILFNDYIKIQQIAKEKFNE